MTEEKTLIGVLASHDSLEQHQSLQNIFKGGENQKKFGDGNYHFLITGGTYDRLLYGFDFKNNVFLIDPKNPSNLKAPDTASEDSKILKGFYENGTKSWFELNSTKLPPATEGGVIILSYLITQRKCSIVWPFFSHESQHWQRLENLAFMRLCDQCHVKRLLNECSVRTWITYEEDKYDSKLKLKVNPEQISFPHFKISDYNNFKGKKVNPPNNLITLIKSIDKLNPPPEGSNLNTTIDALSEQLKNFKKSQDDPVKLPLDFTSPTVESPSNNKVLNDFRDLFYTANGGEKKFEDMTIALIAHDEMKPRMIDFAVDYETELNKFKKILATGTTGREVAAATSKELDNKIFRCHSGPKGGDIEIAAAILYGLCDVVIFFIDPLNAHPHIDDIRVVFQACMMNKNVIIITNEMHAREFMARVVRNNDKIDCLTS